MTRDNNSSTYLWAKENTAPLLYLCFRAMSQYMQTLDPIAKDRYTEKLRLIGLTEDGDPYKLWVDGDMCRFGLL